MIYIYDILLNFNDTIPYEFFEWNKTDTIDHIKKIPLYKVDRKTLSDLLDGTIQVDFSFLTELKDKTEIYENGGVQTLPYVSLFSDGTLALALEFDETGKSICKSRMLLDEEDEVLEYAYDLKEITLSYSLLRKNKISYETRLERQIKSFLKQEFQQAIQENNQEKIKYFYEECFDKAYQNREDASKKLFKSLDQIKPPHKKLYHLLKSSYQLKK